MDSRGSPLFQGLSYANDSGIKNKMKKSMAVFIKKSKNSLIIIITVVTSTKFYFSWLIRFMAPSKSQNPKDFSNTNVRSIK